MTVPTSSPPAAPRSFWIAVICGAVILTIGIGARQSFGIFQKPIAADLHVGRELWSFDTARSFITVNDVTAHGGSFGAPGPAVAGGMLIVGSGYSVRGMPGNVLLAFSTK